MNPLYEKISFAERPFLIAEAGVNYYDFAAAYDIGLLEAAKMMIEKAGESGCDAIKFQSYKAEKLASRISPAYWDLAKEKTTSQFELFKKYDKFGAEEYEKLANYCQAAGIIFMSTPFDYESADFLSPLMPVFKISSSDITNIPFIEYIARKEKPVFLATGASNLQEIDKAVSTIRKTGNRDIAVMHCILDYPTTDENVNLNMIKNLKANFPEYIIGYSDHSLPDPQMSILTTAFLLGATVIEKHFTLNKSFEGNDHYHAADVEDFKKFNSRIDFLITVLGLERKQVVDCEANSRKYARRSLYARHDIPAGTMITGEMLVAKRPGTGISPEYLDMVIGKTTLVDVKEDHAVLWENLN
ncbi:N-acetylneuraminate synthase family protein [Thermodesulfobacteriota bacterium]